MIRLKNDTDQINFIGSWLLDNDLLCDDIIKFFEKNTHLSSNPESSIASFIAI